MSSDAFFRRVGTTSTFYAYDPQGSVAQRLDAAGNVISSDLYDAYGKKLAPNDTTNDPYGYNGQWGYYTDSETGLALCTYRYYDPSNGRWVTRDPIGYRGGVNLYAYVGGDPVNEEDPSGLGWGLGDAWKCLKCFYCTGKILDARHQCNQEEPDNMCPSEDDQSENDTIARYSECIERKLGKGYIARCSAACVGAAPKK